MLFCFLSTAVLSCNRQPPPPAAREPIRVVTPIYILADIVRQIGGERVDAHWWIESGQSLSELQETPERRNQLHNADLVISRGLIDPWTTEGFSSEYEAHRLLRLDRLPAARDADPQQYFWLDPYIALDLADELTNRLAAIDPRNENLFRKNNAAFRYNVLQTCEQFRPAVQHAHGGFLTLDRGFVPLAHRFALRDVPSEPINLADPSSHDIEVLRETAKTAGTRTIFVDDQIPAPLLRDLQGRLDLTFLTLDATGSSAPGSGRSTYIDLLRYNLSQIAKGMN